MIAKSLYYEKKKCGPYWLLSLLPVLAWVLFVKNPLGSEDLPLLLLMYVHGAVVSWGVFRDYSGTSSFYFSRSLTRRTIFLHRILAASLFLAASLLIVFLLMVSGIRQVVQQSFFDSPWYPMVRYYELSIMPFCLLYSVAGTLWFMASWMYFFRRHHDGSVFARLLIFAALFLICPLSISFFMTVDSGVKLIFPVWLALGAAGAILSAYYSMQTMEIDG